MGGHGLEVVCGSVGSELGSVSNGEQLHTSSNLFTTISLQAQHSFSSPASFNLTDEHNILFPLE